MRAIKIEPVQALWWGPDKTDRSPQLDIGKNNGDESHASPEPYGGNSEAAGRPMRIGKLRTQSPMARNVAFSHNVANAIAWWRSKRYDLPPFRIRLVDSMWPHKRLWCRRKGSARLVMTVSYS
jgi:hypothetical protein